MQKLYISYIWFPWCLCLGLQPYTIWSLCLYNWFNHCYLYMQPHYYLHPWWQIVCIGYLVFLWAKICLVFLFIYLDQYGYWILIFYIFWIIIWCWFDLFLLKLFRHWPLTALSNDVCPLLAFLILFSFCLLWIKQDKTWRKKKRYRCLRL